MKQVTILTTVVFILCQISVINGAASDPIIMYNLYNGDKTGGLDNIEDLIGTEHLTFNHLDRYDQNSYETISQITGDFFIGCWVYIVTGNGYETFFSFHDQNDTTVIDLYTDSDSGWFEYETRVYGNNFEFGTLDSSFYNTWSHVGLEYNSNTNFVTGYVNGQVFGPQLNATIDLSQISQNGYLGSSQSSSNMEGGSIAEFTVYNTLFNSEYYTQDISQNNIENTLQDLNNECPEDTVQWNIGNDTSKRVCIHNTCSQNLKSVFSYIQNNLTISTNTSGVAWEDAIDLEYSLSQTDCGDLNTQECFSDKFFRHTILLADDSDYNLTSLPANIVLLKPSEPGFSFADYHNSTSCTHVTNSSTCYFIMPIFFKGIVTNTTFSRDISLIELKFAVQYSQVLGEDTITADLVGQSFSTISHEVTSDVEANFENGDDILSGATLDFDGTPPTSIFIGDSIDLQLQAPSGHQERDFKYGTFEVELIFIRNGTQVVIPVFPSSTTYVNEGNPTGGALRSVQFTIQANYLGTYTIRAGATLESEARRLLQEIDTENSNLKTELQITVTNIEESQSYTEFFLIPIVAFGLIVQYFVLKRKQLSTKQSQQTSKYEKVDLKTQV